MKLILFLIVSSTSVIQTAFCQTPDSPSQPAHRVPRKTNPSPVPEVLKQYDYATQFSAMQDPQNLLPSGMLAPVTPQYATGEKVNSSAQFPTPLLQPKTDVALSPTALEAVRVSEKWRGEKNAPAAGPDGRVLYSFGAGLPTVVCAPLRVCIIELQAGEKIVGEPQIGDSVRWNISPAMYGSGETATSVIVLKPTISGLDTNLLVTTDRRAYYVRLISKPEEYVARVAFQYPDEDSSKKWQQHMIDQQRAELQGKRSSEVLPAMLAVDKLNFGYRVNGGNEHIRPLRVYDDGSKTYIQMPSEMQNREAPALLVIGSDGKGEMANYRVRQQTYIVDRLFDRAELVLGTGKKAQKVEISREPRG